jgi:hypothetical protein
MSDLNIVLSARERDLLARLLHDALGEKRVEVRRTEFSSEFHDQLRSEENEIRQLLDKLSQSAAGAR